VTSAATLATLGALFSGAASAASAGTLLPTDNVFVLRSGVLLETSISQILAGVNTTFVPTTQDQTGALDHANIQSALNSMAADTSGNIKVLSLNGVYYNNQKFVYTASAATAVQQQPIQIIGYGQTTINMVGSNLGCLEFQTVPTASFHGISISGIIFNYLTPQTSSNTASVCLGFRTVLGTDSGNSIFNIYVNNCYFNNGFRGIANTQISGTFAMWGINVTNCEFQCSGASCWFASPSSVGQPNIVLLHNYNKPLSGGSEPFYRIDGGDSVTAIGTEFNLVTNQSAFNISSSYNVQVITTKMEDCTFSSNTNPAIQINNSAGSFDGVLFSNITLTASNWVLFNTGTQANNQSISLRNLSYSFSGAGSTGTATVFSGQGRFVMEGAAPLTQSLGGATFRLVNSGGSTDSNRITFSSAPAGNMSDDNGNTSLTWNPLTLAQLQFYDSGLTANQTVNLAAANGSTLADNSWDGCPVEIVVTSLATADVVVTAVDPTTTTLSPGTRGMWRYRRSKGGYVQVSTGAA